jgi:hypothetical protein
MTKGADMHQTYYGGQSMIRIYLDGCLHYRRKMREGGTMMGTNLHDKAYNLLKHYQRQLLALRTRT